MRPPKPDSAGDQVTGTSIVNIANFLTMLRIVCVPLMVALLFAGVDMTRLCAGGQPWFLFLRL